MSAVAMLRPVDREAVHPILQDLKIEASICDVLSRVTMTQTYKNVSPDNIEAVYTFPLPLRAELLGLTIHLNGRTLKGVVKEKSAAEAEYEDAMESGDSAFMLEQLEPGLYTMNVGNILSGESVTVELVWGQLMEWAGNRMEFRVPTVPGVRYGDPRDAGMDERTLPARGPASPITLSMTCALRGILSDSEVGCPTHELETIQTEEGELVLRTKPGQAIPDRDFVLKFTTSRGHKPGLLHCKDGENHLLVGRFQPKFPAGEESPARNVVLLIDCSGSMTGDSIVQARDAVHRVLSELGEQDRFALVRYGSSVVPIHESLVAVSEQSVNHALDQIGSMEADLGGTELLKGLEYCWKLAECVGGRVDILLVTDGQVTASNSISEKCSEHDCRVHGIGVGSSVTEQTLRMISEQTGGACELVTPRDDMSEKVVGIFRRVRNPQEATVAYTWPGEPLRKFSPAGKAVFDGDTVFACAWYADQPKGLVRMVSMVPGEDAAVEDVQVDQALDTANFAAGEETTELARIIAAKQMKSLARANDEEKAAELALQYQLMSPWTNYIAVYERSADEQADGMPKLARVQQAFPAGSHGFGSVNSKRTMYGVRASRVSLASSDAFEMCDVMPVFSSRKVRELSGGKSNSASVRESRGDVASQSRLAPARHAVELRITSDELLDLVQADLDQLSRTHFTDMDDVEQGFLWLILEKFGGDLRGRDRESVEEILEEFKYDSLEPSLRTDLEALVEQLQRVTRGAFASLKVGLDAVERANPSIAEVCRFAEGMGMRVDFNLQLRGRFGKKPNQEDIEKLQERIRQLQLSNFKLIQNLEMEPDETRHHEGDAEISF